MKTSPKTYSVSVILTVFNRRKLVKRAIRSLLEQSYKDYELIIVDDGSNDGVEKDILPLLKKYPNFRYLKHSNRGIAYSLNAGIAISSGRYITFLDSDDKFNIEHLHKRITFFKKNSDIDLTCSTATIIGKESDMYVPDVRDRRKLIHLNECVIGGTFFGKREVFIELNGFKDMYSHDSEFYKRASKKFKTKKLDIPTYIYYRNTPDSIINKMKKKKA